MCRRLFSLMLVLLMLGWASPALAQQALIQDALRKFLVNAQVFTGTPTFNGGVVINGDAALPFNLMDSTGAGWYVDFSNTFNCSFGLNAASQQCWINYHGYNGGTTQTRTLNIGDGKQFAIAQFFGSIEMGVINGRFSVGGTSAPTAVASVGANSCGTTSPSVVGLKSNFTVTVGATSGTQCRVTMPSVTLSTGWICTMTGQDATLVGAYYSMVDSTHVDFFGTFAAGAKFTALCFPY